MLDENSYDRLLLQYINLESEIELAYRHKLSKSIILQLKQEMKDIKHKLDQLVFLHHVSNFT
ncbi:MAG: hypothetical protein K0T99_02900 [Alphaproteobacteria bacterium]|nr:hypothetical protein [Alphaproteobacteria bacterium]